jgi:hypothetical protein
MKKFLLLIALFSLAIFSQAQTASIELAGNTYAAITTDYTLTNTTAQYFEFHAAKEKAATQDVLVRLDSLSGDHTNVSVALYGKKFSDSPYVAIGSAVNWKGTTADTTIVISNTSANRYTYYKLVYTGTGTGTTKINTQRLKIYLE